MARVFEISSIYDIEKIQVYRETKNQYDLSWNKLAFSRRMKKDGDEIKSFGYNYLEIVSIRHRQVSSIANEYMYLPQWQTIFSDSD